MIVWMRTRFRVPAGLLLVLILAPFAGCHRRSRPNVLLVTIDTLRADHLGCYGYPLARTPNIDRLAAEGLRCANAISAAPITMPSHSTILTGLYPPAHGVRDNGVYALADEVVTLPERLKAKGYATQAFVSAVVLSRRYNLTQGFDGYDDDLWAEDAPKMFMIRDRPAARTAEKFVAWLDGWEKERGRRPFFAWVHFFDPHQPYSPPPQDLALAPTPYDGEITSADRGVGRLIEALRAKGILDDTLVVLTADHGESLGEHQEKTHAIFVYDATVHVPLVWRYPRVMPSGRVYTGPVRSVDIVPTILGVLGLPGGSETQGQDLLGALRGTVRPPELPQYSESLLSELGFGMAPLHAVRWDGYKWIRAPRPELYDLRNDPKELHNLYPGDERRARLLDAELQRILDESGKRATKAKQNPMTRETQEMLQALGYLAPGAERRGVSGMDPKDGIKIYNKLEDARHLAQRKKWEESARLLNEILAQLPGHVSARNVLALCRLRQGRLQEAKDQYLRSLATDPNQFRVHAMLGTVALMQGRLEEAEKQYQTVLAANAGFVEAMANLGFIASLRGDDKSAEEWYQKAIAADPGFPLARRRFGDLHYEAGRYADALGFYEKALEVSPHDFRAAIQAGNSARRLKDPEKAASYFRRAAAMRPDSWVPSYNLACLFAVDGRTKDALAALEVAVSKGLNLPRLLAGDPDLASLRDEPGFRQMADRVRRARARRGEEDDEAS
jgi:arylsulfatase A-like enzyme/Tfp pilus assembly protein PilF